MVGVPAATPVTTPVDAPTVAWLVLLLLQLPPEGVLFNVVVAPTQTLAVPVIAIGCALTVTGCVTKHPPVNV